MSKWPYSTARWKRLRAAHLALEPACRGCKRMGRLTLANTVDHVVAISEGGHAFPGHDGLASYCPACHSAKTARGSEAGAVRIAPAWLRCRWQSARSRSSVEREAGMTMYSPRARQIGKETRQN